MDPVSLEIVTNDAALRERLALLARFVGESVVEAHGDLVLLAPDLDGSLDVAAVAGRPAIIIGAARPNGAVDAVALLTDPMDHRSLLAALAAAHARSRSGDAESGPNAALFPGVVGSSDAMVRVRRLMARVTGNDSTVLLLGESGTGKEVVARALHEQSRRRGGPFVPVNCGAIPAELLESELFGYERGAFTGAVTAKPGRFELAAGGTLFLDEIGDMPLTMQTKVLRAIQERSFERVGGLETRRADVRILAATHRDLEVMIAQGNFREDLFYRLNVFPIELPPLRQRHEDLPELLDAIGRQIRVEQGLSVRLTVDALQVLAAYPWPGNVRELKNLLERLAIEFPNELVATGDLPARFRDAVREVDMASVAAAPGGGAQAGADEVPARLPLNGLDLKEYLARLECSLIEQALADTNSVVARAADRLHIRRTTLVEKMRKYGIERGTGS
ncbi:MAG: sigma-54 dependent transcriptional regulator [Pseudomonadales bacterium]